MHVLVTRAAPATADRWRALGHEVTVAPLLAATPCAWTPPAEVAALAFTSADGVRLAGHQLARYAGLPAFAVGAVTATAARDAGIADVRDGGGTAARLFATIAAAGFAEVLHLAGADRTTSPVPPGLTVVVRTVYAAALCDLTAAVLAALAAGTIDLVPLYSPRSAAHFAAEVDRGGVDRAAVRLAALSPTVAAAAGPGWREVVVAAAPHEDALFDEALRLCDKLA